MRRVTAVLFGASLLAACADMPARRGLVADRHAGVDPAVVAELHGLNPSAPRNCINSFRLRDVQADPHGNTLLYRISSKLIYRNDTSGGCDGLAYGDTLVDQNYPGNRFGNTKLCRGDPLYSRSLRVATASGSCTRGAWVAYSK